MTFSDKMQIFLKNGADQLQSLFDVIKKQCPLGQFVIIFENLFSIAKKLRPIVECKERIVCIQNLYLLFTLIELSD